MTGPGILPRLLRIESGDNHFSTGTEGLGESDRAAVELCFVRANLAKLLGGMGEYQKAIEILEEQVAEVKRLHPTTTAGLYFEIAIGNMYIQMKDIERGSVRMKEVLEKNRYIHGYNKDTILILEMLGDLFVNTGSCSEAAPYYAEALNYLQKNFPGDVRGIQKLTDKYENSKKNQPFEVEYRYLAM